MEKTVGSPTVWVVSDMDRVGKTDDPQDVHDIELYAAKGECAAYQVVVRASESGLSNVNLTVSDLQGPDGSSFPISEMTLYREHYVYVQEGTYIHPNSAVNPAGPGWYPDALIPFVDPSTGQPLPGNARFNAANVSIAAGENQPYWIDIPVAGEAKPGRYTGTYIITSDQGEAAGNVTLTVWDFALPLEPSEASAFVVWEDTSCEVMEEVLKHRMMPCVHRPEGIGYLTDPGCAEHLMKDCGMNMACIGYFSGADMHNYTMPEPPSVEEIKSLVSKMPEGLRLYNYTSDEIVNAPQLNEPMRRWGKNLHEAGVQQLMVAPPIPDLFDDGTGKPVVDIWVVMSLYYYMSPENVEEAKRRGMEIWTYTACNQDEYSPKWGIDFDPVNYRVYQGFMNQSMGFTGYLYWSVDRRALNPDPWTDVNMYIDIGYFPGDAVHAYPGEDVGIKGVVPSLRMKWIRKGFEDYEYVELLKKAGKEDLAMELSQSAARDMKNWSQDAAVYEEVRHKIAQALLQNK